MTITITGDLIVFGALFKREHKSGAVHIRVIGGLQLIASGDRPHYNPEVDVLIKGSRSFASIKTYYSI